MAYKIKTVGLDIAPISSGLSCLSLDSETWQVKPLDAGIVHVAPNHSTKTCKFRQHLAVAHKMRDFVRKHKPDLVGVEDYTNQNHSHIAFSMGELGGVVRHILWLEGYRQLLLTPSRITKLVLPEKSKISRDNTTKWKKHCIEWVKLNCNADFTGQGKEPSDMADATIYALLAAFFFAYHWLQLEPPIMARQREIYFNRIPSPSSALMKKGWEPRGLMDTPYQYLVRNPAKEAETYTPDWMREITDEVTFIGGVR